MDSFQENGNNKQKYLLFFIFLIIFAFAVGTGAFFYFKQIKDRGDMKKVDLFAGFSKLIINAAYADDNFKLEPKKVDSLGIDVDTTYVLTSKEDVDINLIRENLVIEPEVDYKIKKVAEKEWEIIPSELAEPNTFVRIALATSYEEDGEQKARDYSWVYQVKDSFKVLHSIPRDAGVNVPLNTGVEITFSHDNFIEYDKYFSISPQADGKFEKHGRTLVFVPTEQLNAETIYKVTVRAGLPISDSEETLKEDYSFKFETKPNKDAYQKSQDYFYVRNHFIETNTKYPPIISLSANKSSNNTLNVGLYKFNNSNQYIDSLKERDKLPWWSYSKEDFWQDTRQLNLVDRFDLEIQTAEYNQFIELPESLPKGFYLIEMIRGELKQQVWLQVSDLSIYYNITKTDSIFWVNDSNINKPVQGARLNILDENMNYTADVNGVIRFATPEYVAASSNNTDTNERNYVKVSYQNDEIILPISQISRSYSWYGSNDSEDYWYYLYTDRPRYQTTDVIKYWGMLLDREEQKIDEKITISLIKQGYVDYYYRPISIVEQELQLTENNTYSGEIKIENLRPDNYTLELKIGDKVIKTKYISINPYTKPAYQLELVSEKKYALAGEVVKLKGKASFFEGTPVPGLKLIYETPKGKETVVTNDLGEIDLSYIKEYYDCQNNYSCWPEYDTLSIKPEEGELAEIYASNYLQFYGSKIYLEMDRDYPEKGKAEIKMTTKFLDLDRLNQDYSRWPGLGDQIAPNAKVDIEVTKITYTKREIGTYYDFVNKITYKKYVYDRNEEIVDNISVNTDQNGEYVYKTDVEEEASYRMKIKVYDNEGHYKIYNNSIYYYTGRYTRMYSDWRFSYYHLELEDEEKTSFGVGDNVKINFMLNDDPMPDGEKKYLYMQLQNGLQEYSINNDYTYQFSFSRNDIPNVNINAVYFDGTSYITSGSGYWGGRSINFDYNQKDLNINIKTDKEQYKPGEEVKLDISVVDTNNNPVIAEVNLNLVDEAYYAIISDHASPLESIYHTLGSGTYIQGETHEKADVLNSGGAEKGGCFAEGTMILMADGTEKAIEHINIGDKIKTFSDPLSMDFSEGEVIQVWQHIVVEYMIINHKIKVTPEHQVYSNYRFTDAGLLMVGDWLLNSDGKKIFIESIERDHDVISVYNLNIDPQHTYFADGIFVHNQEKGGGPREFFTDAALFQNVSTDNRGKAQASFTLPDNITSWRVTAQAVSKDLYAGVSVSKIPVSLPVFAEITIGNEYLLKDEPVARMRAFGVALNSNDKAYFTIEAPSLNVDKTNPLEANAFQPAYFSLPKLSLGEHAVVYNLETEKGDDAIKLPINVVASRLQANVAKSEKLTADTKIKALNDLPFSVILIDQGQNQLYGPLQRLNWSWGDRVDQKMISRQSTILLNKYYKKDYKLPNFNAFDYQLSSGGVTLLPYSSEELELSARVAAVGAPGFDKESLTQYFFKIIENKESNREEVSFALYGLASLKRPILPRINSWLNRDDLSAKELLYLAQAMYDLGDYEKAREIFYNILKKYGEEKKPQYIVRVSDNIDEVFHATAIAAVLATSLNMEQAQGMFNYVVENQKLYGTYKNSENLFNLEKYNYINHALPNLKPSPAIVNFELFGKEKNIEITGGSYYSFQLYPSQVDQVKFNSIQGDVGITMSYISPIDLKDTNRDDSIGIKREYYVNGTKTNKFSEKDMIQVRLYPSFNNTALAGYYQITDVLPSGLMPVTKLYRGYNSGCNYWYPYNTDGQMVKFRITKDWKNWYCGGDYFYYYARPKNKGNYVAEPTIIQSFINPEYINYSDQSNITIQ